MPTAIPAASSRSSPTIKAASRCSPAARTAPSRACKAVLRPFQRLLVSWSGRGEACQLVSAEIDGAATALPNERLMSGFYLNELLLKLTERCDPHPEIFVAYSACIEALARRRGRGGASAPLREAPAGQSGVWIGVVPHRRRRSGRRRRLLQISGAARPATLRGGCAGRRLRPIARRSRGGERSRTRARSRTRSACCGRPSTPVSTDGR